MLPDLGNQYTLDIQAYMTSYKSDVTMSNGMLQKVVFDLDNTKVASDAIAAAGDVTKAKIDQIGAAAATEQSKQQQAQLTRDKLQLQIELKNMEIQQLESQQPVDSSKLQKARADLAVLEDKLRFLNRTGDSAAVSNAPSTASNKTIAYLEQPGAVLYKVVQGPDSVRLVAVNKQAFLRTVLKSPAGSPTKPKDQSQPVIGPTSGKAKAGAKMELPLKSAPEGFQIGTGSLSQGAKEVGKLKPVLRDEKTILVPIPENTLPGIYKLEITWSATGNPRPGDPISLSVIVE